MQTSWEELLRPCLQRPDMQPEEIPNLDLYMDQIITLFESVFGDGKEKSITKTMINNYSKDGVLRPIRGKKYSREHVLRIVLIYLLKPVLSIGQIKQLLEGLELEESELERQYRIYLERKPQMEQEVEGMVQRLAPEGTPEETLLPLILSLAWISRCTGDMCSQLVEQALPTEKKAQMF
ncbi:MAG: DUF1836 domain-containing protein [Eubacteriales bacterium]|jgi:DNA-binding transcriptional MerR regulator